MTYKYNGLTNTVRPLYFLSYGQREVLSGEFVPAE